MELEIRKGYCLQVRKIVHLSVGECLLFLWQLKKMATLSLTRVTYCIVSLAFFLQSAHLLTHHSMPTQHSDTTNWQMCLQYRMINSLTIFEDEKTKGILLYHQQLLILLMFINLYLSIFMNQLISDFFCLYFLLLPIAQYYFHFQIWVIS